MKLTGEYQITGWDGNAIKEFDDGSKQSYAKVSQKYEGDITGSSESHYVMAYRSPQSAVFVGHELIECEIHNEKGSFIIQHDGTFEAGIAQSEFKVVSGSGKGACAGYKGRGSFKSTAEKVPYEKVPYEFEIELAQPSK